MKLNTEYIRFRLKKLHWNLVDFSRELGVTPATASKYVRRKNAHNISINLMNRIAATLRIPAEMASKYLILDEPEYMILTGKYRGVGKTFYKNNIKPGKRGKPLKQLAASARRKKQLVIEAPKRPQATTTYPRLDARDIDNSSNTCSEDCTKMFITNSENDGAPKKYKIDKYKSDDRIKDDEKKRRLAEWLGKVKKN